jgi:cobalt-zinc-cadmium resistance protein CzcA
LLSNQKTRLDLFENYISLAERKFQLGDIDLLEKTLLENEYYQMEQKLAVLNSDTRIAENELKKLLYISDTLKQPSSLIYRPMINQPEDSLRNDLVNLLETYHELLNEIGNKQLKLERSAFFPEISGGYFNQQIDGASGFDGWQIGLSFPIFPFREASAAKQAKIQQEIIENELFIYKNEYLITLDNSFLKMEGLETNLQFYNQQMIRKFERMRETSQSRYEAGSIDYLEFIQLMKAAFNIFDDYSMGLKNYNETLIELKYMIPDFYQK